MVVKYLKGGVQTGQTSAVWSTEEILTQISSLELSHPNIAQFYGRGVSRDGKTRFIVLRTGAYQVDDYLSQARANDTEFFKNVFR
ncbi:hypothetical protein EXIGLDRAFT_847787, partial [Exidia glandulosa HHB12029]